MLSLLYLSLLLQFELLSTLLLGKFGLSFTFFAWQRLLMALPRLRMPMETLFFNDLLAKQMDATAKGRVAFGWTCVDTTTELCAARCPYKRMCLMHFIWFVWLTKGYYIPHLGIR